MPDLRYKNVGYVAINVTDRDRSTAFQHETIGLETNPAVDSQTFGATLLRVGRSAAQVALYDAAEPGLRRIAFEMESERYLDAALKHLSSLGVKTWDVPAKDRTAFAQRASFRFAEPNTDLTVELYVGNDAAIPAPATDRPRSNLDRLGHVVLNVIDPPAVTKFFTDEMNFRVSDYIDKVAFMRCFPNPFHHSLAIVPGPENRLNHVNFLVHSLDDFGQCLNRAKRQKVEIVFGPGRHPPSGSVFLYFLDPDALTFEFSTGMEQFPETGYREPLRYPLVPESFDYWGGARDPRHGQVGRFVLEESNR
jgi:2,3-dihydroxy-p-cumate/2,3-dihydroxybenzoate 3,4-dioxygenase